VIAYDTSGTAIGSSNEMTFTVQGPPTAPPPPPTSGGSSEIKSPIAAVSVDELFKTIINFLFYLSMGIAPVMIIYAAFLMLTSAGKPEQTSKAKTIILWTLVATAVILFAKGLPAVIKGALGG
ncbi:MAG: hypothetical protein Q7K28_02630, partial [Candidatus Wildermuthbacteria bacterium]|nr:hypothetical protein [Candidatus Wildermuthbacteria bacterium]